MQQIRMFVFMVHFNKKWHFVESNYVKSLNSAGKYILSNEYGQVKSAIRFSSSMAIYGC